MDSNNNQNNIEVQDQDSVLSLSESWSALSPAERRKNFKDLPRTEAEELFLSLKTHDQAELIEEATHLEKRSWIRLLAPDDVADLIQEMGADHREDILSLLDPQTKREVTALLAYAEDAAGGLMSSRFVRLRPDMSVDEAISYIRIQAKTHVETIYYAYVLDSDQKLLGVVSFRELFQSSPEKKIAEIMHTDVLKVPVEMDQEQIGRIFSQQDLMAVPVVDENGIMKGIVTFDDVATAIQEEATEDIHKIGGVESLDAPYLKISMLEMLKKRGGWLLILFLGQMFTATAMAFFEDELSKAMVLSMFIPLIISSGGNSGSQASTLIIRAIALREVRLRDWWRVLGREIMAGACLGLVLGAIGFIRIMLWPNRETLYTVHYMHVGLTVAVSVVGVVLWGTISGSMLPFLLKKAGFDPASASAPAVATLVDVTGLVIYFTAASFFLTGILF
ncbi:magnesium transporter [Bdellovibrio bacteriovorus]|uniref:Magnesium transporter MgtE n=1 Tax=Bdellovibrio bacteriovorus (strain ATCC 15356 / DSM 50701 / NCIMB 9529 / HD100) TaxID=264462 RepID=Q6MK67_BDEBA|nr:magnesium transporter [Bdellovibrio bacteriovorus]AHZ85048.1 Mg2+ transporter MgtE [Bdellovibrio bacteriovorus]BEV68936.1 Magnesium transporter MgtE [Bdellovibrio bacteriovorus]CAE80342.1 Mg2+ transporter MgtE [Bdellovibrio bacteriovorus HD100]